MIEKYVLTNLASELNEIRNTFRNTELTMLSDYEKAIIYKYTDDGYESINEILRASSGKVNNKFGTLLNKALGKLPNYSLLCYRTAKLSSLEKNKYIYAYRSKTSITEHSFVSCTKSKLLAMMFRPFNVLFTIHSKYGKEIENIAKFGINSGQNEKEILFKNNSNFSVLNITTDNDGTLLIIMEEV